MMDLRPRWTIRKNPPHLPRDKALPWTIYETAARMHGEPLVERFRSYRKAKRWALKNAPGDTEIILIKTLKSGF